MTLERKHEKSPLGEVTPKPKRCTVHEEELKLMCKTCDKKLICLMCTTHGEHKNHESVLVKQEMEILRSELRKKIVELDQLSKKITDAKRIVEKNREEIHEVISSFCCLNVERELRISMKM